MKLVIKPDGMKILTETVQDVAYFKQIGCGSEDPEVYLKVSVAKTSIAFSGFELSRFGAEVENAPKEGIEIDVYWENVNSGREGGTEGDREIVDLLQHIEGPRLKFVKKINTTKANS